MQYIHTRVKVLQLFVSLMYHCIRNFETKLRKAMRVWQGPGLRTNVDGALIRCTYGFSTVYPPSRRALILHLPVFIVIRWVASLYIFSAARAPVDMRRRVLMWPCVFVCYHTRHHLGSMSNGKPSQYVVHMALPGTKCRSISRLLLDQRILECWLLDG